MLQVCAHGLACDSSLGNVFFSVSCLTVCRHTTLYVSLYSGYIFQNEESGRTLGVLMSLLMSLGRMKGLMGRQHTRLYLIPSVPYPVYHTQCSIPSVAYPVQQGCVHGKEKKSTPHMFFFVPDRILKPSTSRHFFFFFTVPFFYWSRIVPPVLLVSHSDLGKKCSSFVVFCFLVYSRVYLRVVFVFRRVSRC